MSEKSVLLLVHGFGGGARDYRALEKFFGEQEYPIEFVEFFYTKKYGQESLDEVADELAVFVRECIGGRKFFTVGLSQGGIILRRFLFRHKEYISQVRAAVTICTPHQGSCLAYCWFGRGVADLRPGSRVLRELAEFDDGLPYYAVFNPCDELVFPGTNAKYVRAVMNKEVLTLLHFATFIDKRTLQFVADVLRRH
jgi:triacylglycerol lipase